MKKKYKLSTLLGFLASVSGIIWFGAYISRLITYYQLFKSEDLSLNSFVSNGNLPGIIQTIYPLVNLTFFSYLIFIFFFTLFIILTPLKLKENGWLFIISMVVYITLPFEAILLTIDYKMILMFLSENFTSGEILKLITERLTMFNSFPIILLLSYLTIPFFLIYKPFILKSKNEN